MSHEMPSWFEFLRIEADLTMTFIRSARAYFDPADSARSLERARMALAVIQRSLMNSGHCGLSEGEALFLEQLC
jgi:Tfp pilus assembly protein PilW